MIEATLSYVPVTNTNTPSVIMDRSLISMGVERVPRCEASTSSMTGGKTRASAVLLTAPTSEMNSPN